MAENFSKSDKDYGLPKVELTPIDRGQPGVAKVSKKPVSQEPHKTNRLIPWLVALGFLLLIGGLAYYFFWASDPVEIKDRQAQEEILDDEADDKPGETTMDDQSAENEITSEDEDLQQPEIRDEPGSIATISQRTGRYYIFLGSYKFRAYARRHADKLAKDGFAVKLITPDNWVGVRVAVGTYSSMEEAGSDAEMIKTKYGNEVVVSKY